MKALWSWIREFVPVEGTPEDVADRLSMRALKVESVEHLGGDITGVVVGSVVKMEEHPDADKLMLVTVDTGNDVREIVCGARNYSPGDRVPVALPGAKLPGDFEIAERTVRGKVSHGMMCSARELQLSDDHSGIMILPADAPLGADVRKILGLDDVVVDIDVTANRPDALSIVGIAREIAAMEGLPLSIPAPALPQTGATSDAGVTVRDAKGCPRYLARVVTGLSNGASPDWMQRRLVACGMRPISAIVDITNYVLLERGHPLHAFDLSKLEGRQIVVRKARKGEKITTLDETERTLETSDITICDAARPVAVAGIMGGATSEVSTETTEVLLESAWFEPGRVAATARRLGLRTEASVRFERGADIDAVPSAADRACALLVEICGGTVSPTVVDVAARRPARKAVRVRVPRAATTIGVDLSTDDASAMLSALGMDVSVTGKTLRVTPPSFRPDISIEEDLIEEIARSYGYERIPETLPGGGRAGGLTREQHLRRVIRRSLLGVGLNEAHTLSLLSPTLPDRFGLDQDHPWRNVLRLSNPLSEEESVLRPAVLPGLLLAAERNNAHRAPSIALFEVGVAFEPSGEELPNEELRAAWIMAGKTPGGWHGEAPFDIFDSKGVVESLATAIGCRNIAIEPDTQPHLHPGRTARVSVAGVPVGWIGELHPSLGRALDIPGRIAVGEIAISHLIANASDASVRDIPRFPAIERDLAVVVPEGTQHADVVASVMSAAGELLEGAVLFDVYRGEQVGESSVSLAYRLSFRDPSRTLTDTDASEAMGRVVFALGDRGWKPRA